MLVTLEENIRIQNYIIFSDEINYILILILIYLNYLSRLLIDI